MSTVSPKVPVAILVSGRGSNMRALLEASRSGQLPAADIRLVLSNQPAAPALEVARQYGVEAIAIDHRRFGSDRGAHEEAVIAELRRCGIEVVVMAGYMRLVTRRLIEAFEGRMINIHPSLLPAFPGTHAQRQALQYGAKISGCTVHFVTEEMDAGPIILQHVVPVLPMDTEDTLAARILAEEHHALPNALNLLTQGRLRVNGRLVEMIEDQSALNPTENYMHPRSLEILVATGNRHKLVEIGQILREFPIIFRGTHEFDGVTEPDESAPDYLGNAKIKAQVWNNHTGLWTLADDSGLEVDALGGRPGVKSARYAPTEKERITRLLGELEGVPEEKRTARFVCAVVLVGPNGEEHHAIGTCEGRIAFEPRGDKGFGYDPIFIPDGFGGRHLAELSEATKNNISHRALALYALKPTLGKLLRMGSLT
jgi:phosphoribosylglycinamide formyltransferase-1